MASPLAVPQQQSPIVISGYTWDQYLSIEELFSDSGVRIRYLDHQIEIMPPVSEEHEHRKSNLGCLVEAWCLEKEIRFFVRGNTTMTKAGSAGGEPDESYCFGEKKEISDLVIEVALTSGGLSKRAFYKKFGVPELWFWRNEKLEVYFFETKTGEYVKTDESQVLPGINLTDLAECAKMVYASDAIVEFRKRIAAA